MAGAGRVRNPNSSLCLWGTPCLWGLGFSVVKTLGEARPKPPEMRRDLEQDNLMTLGFQESKNRMQISTLLIRQL